MNETRDLGPSRPPIASSAAVKPTRQGSSYISDGATLGLHFGSDAGPDGEASEDGVFCGDWTVPDDSLVRFGSVSAADDDWTYRPDTSWCFDIARLYCFED